MQSTYLENKIRHKINRTVFSLTMAFMALVFTACSPTSDGLQLAEDTFFVNNYNTPVYLYGEQHAVERILEKQIEIWDNYYHKQNMRYLFIEVPYYTAQYLNQWMQAEDDAILEQVFADLVGTAIDRPIVKDFYRTFKSDYPETVFVGTDVGHQYNTTGARYLKELNQQNLQDSEDYRLTQIAIEQGREFYRKNDAVYRENMMVKNFIMMYQLVHQNNLENDLVGIMGIYGSAHTGINDFDFSNNVPSMANQLKNTFHFNITSTDLRAFAKLTDPESVEIIELNGREYRASYFGQVDVTGFKEFTLFKYYRIEEAYEDFKHIKSSGDYLPCAQYPMTVEKGQVLMLETIKKDGTITRHLYRTDGNMRDGEFISNGFGLDGVTY